MADIYIGDQTYNYEDLNTDVLKSTKNYRKYKEGLFIIEANGSYEFIVKYLSIHKTLNSIFIIEDYNLIDDEVLNQLKLIFINIYLPNNDLLENKNKINNRISNSELILSSGTSAKKKIIVLNKNTVWKSAERINNQFKVDRNTCEYILMDFHHSFGITRLRCALKRKSNIFIAKNLLDPKMLKVVFDNESSIFFGSVSKGLELFISYFGKYIAKNDSKYFYIETGSMEITNKLIDQISK